MTSTRPVSSPSPDDQPSGDVMSARPFVALAALGTASALWAIFLWRELILARAGETPFCGFGESLDCGTLWSAAFASSVHHATGLPVAGWGLAWGLVTTLLPLAALSLGDRRGSPGGGQMEGSPGGGQTKNHLAAACSAIDLSAAAGLAGVVVLLAASAQERLFCTSCALTYLLTVAYAAVTFLALRRRPLPRSPHGATLAAAVTAVVYLSLLYPGLKTPKSLHREGQQALAAVGQRAGDELSQPAGGSDHGRRLDELLATLSPQALQGLSDSIHIFASSPTFPSEEPRVLAAGSRGAAVRITEFTDTLCGHCATLHQTVAYLATLVPPASFNVDSRQFPLDGNCNPHLPVRGPESVRCMAARARICVEDTGRGFAFAGDLFEHQQGLTSEQVMGLATPFIDRAALEQCLASAATRRKLSDDVDYAWRYRPSGTPLVLIDGRQGTWFGPFLYAMILTGGRTDHPALAQLPPPRPGLLDGSHDHGSHDHGSQDRG